MQIVIIEIIPVMNIYIWSQTWVMKIYTAQEMSKFVVVYMIDGKNRI